MANVNPMWESLQISDEEVVEHFGDLIPKDDRNIDVDFSMVGKKELNDRVGLYVRDLNYFAKLEEFKDEGFIGKEAELTALKYADDLHEIFQASIQKLYKEREAGNTIV